MMERPNHEERQKLLAGDNPDALTPDEAAELPLLADLLGDPSTWAEPSAALEDNIVQAITAAPEPAGARSIARHRAPSWRWRFVSVAAVAAVAAAAIVANLGGGPSADFTAQLASTEIVPGAHASAAITRNGGGFRIALHASGLAPLPTGQYYEAWLKNASGTLVPVGTFSSSGDPVTLWSGVSPADFPTMTITIELDDNDQASSGHVILAGPVNAKG